MESFPSDRAQLPRNMIENSMFEEEPDVLDLAKDPQMHPLEPEEVEYEPRSSRLLVRGLGEQDLEEEEEDYESSARLLGMSFMNRSSNSQNRSAGYRQQGSDGTCHLPCSARTCIVCMFIVVLIASVAMLIYFLPKCTFTKEGCNPSNNQTKDIYPLATNGKIFPWAMMRLPDTVLPEHYELLLHPDLINRNVSGFETVTVLIKEETKKIIMHSSGLHIISASFKALKAKGGADEPVPNLEVLEYPKNQQIALIPAQSLEKGIHYHLELKFTANLSSTIYGFYNSSYKLENETVRELAATQFEPLAARMAFPCFDEPAFKATFQIKIKRPNTYTTLSNMPKNSSTPVDNDLVLDEFQTSLKMSTYLVAFIVADFKNVSRSFNGTLVSVHFTPGKEDQAHYALEAGCRLLDFYVKYFNISYPLEKLDLVAVPDFQAGAMENWGVITFGETALLYNESTSSIMDKQFTTKVIAHELAHQWFGNLVTMKWWNDLWLNEGFATFMSYVAMDYTFPDLSNDDDFLRRRFKGMEQDSLNSSHPLTTRVETPEQIEEMFDSVSYVKGASILLMLKTFLSEDVFKLGIKDYLNTHKFGSTTSEDLWKSLSKFSKSTQNVPQLMETWSTKKGFPLVTVRRNGAQIELHQEPFIVNMDLKNLTLDTRILWQIPLTYITFNSTTNNTASQNTYLLSEKSGSLSIASEVSWIKFNVKMSGYYMVDYGDHWHALIEQLQHNHSVFHPSDRADLINSIFRLASIGKVPLTLVVNLSPYLIHETSTLPVIEALDHFDHIYGLLEKRGFMDLASRVQDFALKLFDNIITKQNWTDDGFLVDRKLRSAILSFACRHQHLVCVRNAKQMFDDWIHFPYNASLPTDVMETVFYVGAQTDDGWMKLWSKYILTSSAAEKRKMLNALSASPDIKHLLWLMQAGLDGDLVKMQDLPQVLVAVSENLVGHLHAWNFVKENWESLTKKFQLGSFSLHTIVSGTTSQFSTKAHLFEVQTFFESQKENGSQLRVVKEAVETIKANIQWMDKNLQYVEYLL
ncbi:leucyl-cystinyl aminopeptidase [Protopterus annectens]|uniref:leucyl-cystinyl aminopeptidase n=1 Tax=Protopterus annectens TaxID=7888 RepID=UPI001CFACC08|nr:leucyl-cystinyl aminopeptidase [Protopterus annectens]